MPIAFHDDESVQQLVRQALGSAKSPQWTKLERIIAWCASHPDEVPFVLHQFMGRPDKHPPQTSKT